MTLPFFRVTAISTLLFASAAQAHSTYYSTGENSSLNVAPFISYESSSQGDIVSAGFQFGSDTFKLVTALAQYQGTEQAFSGSQNTLEFTNLDTSLRIGRFDEISFYGEVGIALDELLIDEEGETYYDDYGHQINQMGPLDWFAGVGIGLNSNNLSLTAFGRYRYLRSYEQEYFAQYPFGQSSFEKPQPHQWFAGVELTLRF